MQIDKICFPANTLKRWLQIRSVQVLFCFSKLLFDLSDSFWSMEIEIESRLFGYLTSNPIEINNALFNRIWEGTQLCKFWRLPTDMTYFDYRCLNERVNIKKKCSDHHNLSKKSPNKGAFEIGVDREWNRNLVLCQLSQGKCWYI